MESASHHWFINIVMEIVLLSTVGKKIPGWLLIIPMSGTFPVHRNYSYIPINGIKGQVTTMELGNNTVMVMSRGPTFNRTIVEIDFT